MESNKPLDGGNNIGMCLSLSKPSGSNVIPAAVCSSSRLPGVAEAWANCRWSMISNISSSAHASKRQCLDSHIGTNKSSFGFHLSRKFSTFLRRKQALIPLASLRPLFVLKQLHLRAHESVWPWMRDVDFQLWWTSLMCASQPGSPCLSWLRVETSHEHSLKFP